MCYDNPESAKEAETDLNDKDFDGRILTVAKFVKKTERMKQMKRNVADKNKKLSEAHNNNL